MICSDASLNTVRARSKASQRDTAWLTSSGSSLTTPAKAPSSANAASKKWNRPWKLDLIEKSNPGWRDLFDEVRLGGLKDAEHWTPGDPHA